MFVKKQMYKQSKTSRNQRAACDFKPIATVQLYLPDIRSLGIQALQSNLKELFKQYIQHR